MYSGNVNSRTSKATGNVEVYESTYIHKQTDRRKYNMTLTSRSSRERVGAKGYTYRMVT